MRVTTNIYTNNYLRAHNSLQSNLMKNQQRILSQKKFTRAHEDSLSVSKAYNIRKSLAYLDTYDNNCKSVKDLFAAAESFLYDIADNTYLNIHQKLLSVQDTFNNDNLSIIGKKIEDLADHCIQNMNSDFSGRPLFGGSSNQKTPFTKCSYVEVFDNNGLIVLTVGDKGSITNLSNSSVVCYNNVPVNLAGRNLIKVAANGHIVYYNNMGTKIDSKNIKVDLTSDETGTENAFPGNKNVYVDIGLDINYDNLESTAIDTSLNGVEITGYGIDKDGDSQNYLQLLYDIAQDLKEGRKEAINAYLDKLEATRTRILEAITNLGLHQTSVDNIIKKNEGTRLLLKEKQNSDLS